MERVVEMKSPAEVLGARLLSDIQKEEGSLESVCPPFLLIFPSSTIHVHCLVVVVVGSIKVAVIDNR